MKHIHSIIIAGLNLLMLGTSAFSQEFKFLSLGDSYTIGEAVAEEHRWPNQLTKVLLNEGIQINVSFVATTGWRTDDLLNAMNEVDFQPTYDLISIQIGVNNQYQNRDFSLYEPDLIELIDRAIALTGGDTGSVFLVGIPNYGCSPFGAKMVSEKIATELEAYNQAAKSVCSQLGIVFIDINRVSCNESPDWFAADGLHPSKAQYAAWVQEILKGISFDTVLSK